MPGACPRSQFRLATHGCPVKLAAFDVVAVHSQAAATDRGLAWLRQIVRGLFD